MKYKPMGNKSWSALLFLAEIEDCTLTKIKEGEIILIGDWWLFGSSYTQIQTHTMGLVLKDMIVYRLDSTKVTRLSEKE